MKSNLNSNRSNLSPDVVEACRVRGRKQGVKNIVKSVIFYVLAFGILYLTASQSDLFTPKSEPFWFAVVQVVIIAIPILLWAPYRLFTERDFRGTIVAYRNKRVVDHSEEDARGPFFDRGRMGMIDVYIIKAVSENGRKRTFTIKRANTEFGRVYYQKGDVIRCPRFAHLPFNESRPLPRPYCIWCGSIGSPNETVCKCCQSPYSLIPEDGAFTPAVSTVPVEAPKRT